MTSAGQGDSAAIDYVATLVASADTMIDENRISDFVKLVLLAGNKVAHAVTLDKGRAADVFFSGRPVVYQNNDNGYDVLIQPAARRRKKILLTDMESTIIEQEMLDELAVVRGVGAQVAAITRRAMNGELDFAAALRERVGLLKGMSVSQLEEAASRMTLTPGACELVAAMQRAGSHCWLVSGGFAFFVKKIADRLGFERFFANDLEVEAGVLTGRVRLPILGQSDKERLLRQACAEYGHDLAETVTVGDGANDIPMLAACAAGAGLGVAYRAKPNVRQVIAQQINRSDLSALIYAQGLA